MARPRYVRRWSTHGKFVSHEAWMESYRRHRGRTPGHHNEYLLLVVRDGQGTFYYDDEDMITSATIGLEVHEDVDRLRDYYARAAVSGTAYLECCEAMSREDLASCPSPGLADRLQAYFDCHAELLAYYKLSAEEFSAGAEHALAAQLAECTDAPAAAMQALLAVDSSELGVSQERAAWLGILEAARRDVDDSAAMASRLQAHTRQFGFLGAAGGTPQGWSQDHFRARLARARGEGLEPCILSQRRQIGSDAERLGDARRQAAALNLPDSARILADGLRTSTIERMRIRETFTRCAHLSNGLFQEIYSRVRRDGGAASLDVEVLRQLSFQEMLDFLRAGTSPDAAALRRRYEGCVYGFLPRGDVWTWQADAVLAFEQECVRVSVDARVLRGVVANSGAPVVARARVIDSGLHTQEKQRLAEEMRQGEVLVTGMTHPNIILACEKASAIVTDQGGVTCHAAIIARELGIPCIIATRVASRRIASGDLLRVDSNEGTVSQL